MSRRSELQLRRLVLIVATKDYTRTSQQRGRDQHADHDRGSPTRPLHTRDERGRRTKATKRQCNGGNGDISSIHKTTSSKRKTLFLMN